MSHTAFGFRHGVVCSLLAKCAVMFAAAAPEACYAQLIAGFATRPAAGLTRYEVARSRFQSPLSVASLSGVSAYAMAADANGLYISNGSRLYRWNNGATAPTLVGSFSGEVTNVGGGMAWDSVRGILYGTGGSQNVQTSKLVEINPITAATTLVRSFEQASPVNTVDLGGMDFDPATQRLIFSNDNVGVLSGRGVYAIAWPYASATPAFLATYPMDGAVQETDIDGIAVGGGYVWLVADEREWSYPLNLTTMVYEAPVAQLTVSSDSTASGATWAPNFMDQVEHDLRIVLAVPAPCSVRISETLVVSALLTHIGGTVTTPGARATFTIAGRTSGTGMSSVPAGAWQAGTGWVVPLGAIVPNAARTVQLTITDASVGDVLIVARAASDNVDPVPADNESASVVRVRGNTGGAIVGAGLGASVLASTIASDASSALEWLIGDTQNIRHAGLGAGLVAARVVRLGVDDLGAAGIARSPDGAWGLVHVLVERTSGAQDLLLVRVRSDASESGTIVARRGVGPRVDALVGPALAPSSLEAAAINDLGDVAFVGKITFGNASRACVVRATRSGLISLIAEQAATDLPALGFGVRVGSNIGGPVIGANSDVAYVASIGGVSSAFDRAILANDGNTLLAQRGVTLPTGQVDGNGATTIHFARDFDTGVPGRALSANPTLNTWLAPATIAGSVTFPTTSGLDRVAIQGFGFSVVACVAQENIALQIANAGATLADIEPLGFMSVDAAAAWWLSVRRNDGSMALIRNGEIITQSGQVAWTDGPIWAAQSTATDLAFVAFANAANAENIGESAIAGGPRLLAGRLALATSTPTSANVGITTLNDSVVILMGSGQLLRENELVMGEAASSVFVREIMSAGVVVSSADALAMVTLRGLDSAEACTSDAAVGTALLRIPISTACTACAADFNQDGGVTGDDVSAFFFEYESGATCADVNIDGGITGDDVAVFFMTFEAGGC